MFSFFNSITRKSLSSIVRESGMVESGFNSVSITKLRDSLREKMSKGSFEIDRKMFQNLRTNYEGPYTMIKILVTIHLFHQISSSQNQFQESDLLIDEVHKVLQEARRFHEKEEETNIKDIVQSALTASLDLSKKKANISPSTIQKMAVDQMMSDILAEAKYSSSCSTQDSSIYSQAELNSLLYEKIIFPYASFLLKSLSQEQTSSGLSGVNKVWNYLNSLKNILPIAQSFPKIMRYYGEKLGNMVLVLIQTFDFEVKRKYEPIYQILTLKLNEFQEKFIPQSNTFDPEEIMDRNMSDPHLNNQITELHQIFQELFETNEMILRLYENKYTKEQILGRKIKKPKLIFISDPKIVGLEQIFCVLQRQNKRSRKNLLKSQSLQNSPKPFLKKQKLDNWGTFSVNISRLPRALTLKN